MLGFISAIISGIAMSIQGVFNTRLSEKIGDMETNVVVHGSALVIAIILVLFWGKGDFKSIKDVNKLYLLGGALGIIITLTVMLSIKSLGTTIGIGTILIAQLAAAGIINAFGLFGSEKISFSFFQFLGLGLMILCIIILKWNH